MTSLATKEGTSYGPELLVGLRGGRRRAQLEDRLRELVREGTLAAGSRMPSSRALAGDLGVSRRLVVDAYAQLLAEGYLVCAPGRRHVRRRNRGRSPTPRRRRSRRARRSSTSSPAHPTSRRSRERCGCARCATCCARRPTARSPIRTRAARRSCAARSAPTCAACAGWSPSPTAIVVCSGATQGLALLGRALVAQGVATIDVEDPGPAAAPRGAAVRRAARARRRRRRAGRCRWTRCAPVRC